MKNLLRILLVLFLVIIGVAAALFFIGRQRVYSRPAWYPQVHLDAQQRAAAANRADQKLIATRSEIAQAYAQQTRNARTGQAPSTQPASGFVLDLTQDEINAWIPKWEQQLGWKAKLGAYLSDPTIVFQQNEIILAATVKDWHSIVSLHFVPTVQNGRLKVTLAQVMAGTLPLPRAAWSGYLDRLESGLKSKLPDLQQDADIDAHGKANAATVQAAMSELLLHTLNDQPAEPVLFLPDQMGHNPKSLPVQISDISVTDQTLSLTVQPMDAEQRTALLQHIKGPVDTATAMNQ